MKYNIAIVGATGNVGHHLLDTLHNFDLGYDNVYALASSNSLGKQVSFGDYILNVVDTEGFDFSQIDIAIFSAGGAISKKYAPIAAKAGAVVIDNSSYFRMDENVPLVVPEVNPEDIDLYKNTNIIANPNCSTIQMVVVLNALRKLSKIQRVVVSTYQSVSGAGKKAMDELFNNSKKKFSFTETNNSIFTKNIAFNVIPHIDSFDESGYTKEELKMIHETDKIMHGSFNVTATCVRVPVFIGHAESVNIEFQDEVSANQAREILYESPGILVIDKQEDGGYATPIDVAGEYGVYVSRLRKDNSNPKALNLWIVADNMLKGAALNAVQIAEILIEKELLPKHLKK